MINDNYFLTSPIILSLMLTAHHRRHIVYGHVTREYLAAQLMHMYMEARPAGVLGYVSYTAKEKTNKHKLR